MDNSKLYKSRAHELVSRMTIAERMAQLKYDAPAIERLGVPAYNWWNECLHGVGRSGAATVFPQAIAMAASFNAPLMKRVGTAISDEARAKYNEYKKKGYTGIYQGLTYWSPNINIFRDPRWGRGHETYGEDPYLTGYIAAAFISGLQGDDPKYRKLDATIKHYAAHSGPESIRHGFNVTPDKNDLWETYLSAFAYCIENADPSAVMGAYNAIDGEPCCASETMLGRVLRGKLGFTGYVVSDCGAITDINQFHKMTKNEAESAAWALKSGCDLNCGQAYAYLKVAYGEGMVDDEVITTACERLFEARIRLGMFDSDCEYDKIPYDIVECDAHTALNREMAAQSVVLCKNDGILPLKGAGTIAVIGPNADNKLPLLGNYNGTPSKYTTLLRGIQEGCGRARVIYARGCHMFNSSRGDWEENPMDEAVLAARHSDIVIMIMGLDPTMEGEQGDAYNGQRGGDRADLELPECQKELYRAVKAVGKPIVFVNVSGSAVDLCEQDGECAAVVQCFYPGAEGGAALADILFGRVSPSGRLPLTFYRSIDDVPPFEDYSMNERTYKYFTGAPLYPFAHGLSYTDFAASNLSVQQINGGIAVACNISNTGKYDSDISLPIFLRPSEHTDGDPYVKLVHADKIHIYAGACVTWGCYIARGDIELYSASGDKFLRGGEYTLTLGACDAGNALAAAKVILK